MTDFSKVLIRCSSIGKLMTEPRGKSNMDKWIEACEKLKKLKDTYSGYANKDTKTASNTALKIFKLEEELKLLEAVKDIKELSETAKSHLVRVFVDVKYGRRREMTSKYTEKGKAVEEDSIDLYCQVKGGFMTKNTDRINNEFLTGEPDLHDGKPTIYCAKKIVDIKSCWDAETFYCHLTDGLDPDYEWQVQGYMGLSGAKEASVAYCLVNTPESIINGEKYKLLKQMDVVSEENPEYQRAAAILEYNMKFDDIPADERLLEFQVERDDEAIEQIYEKVGIARKFLAELESRQMDFKIRRAA